MKVAFKVCRKLKNYFFNKVYLSSVRSENLIFEPALALLVSPLLQASVMKTLVSGYNEKTRILLQFLVKGCYSSYSARLKKTFIVPDPCCRNSIHWGNQGNYTPANPYSEGKICSPETARY